MAQTVLVNMSEMAAQVNSLRTSADRLRQIETKYRTTTNSMAAGWKGESGKSFDAAAVRILQGYVANSAALEQLICDADNAIKTMEEQDAESAKIVDAAMLASAAAAI